MTTGKEPLRKKYETNSRRAELFAYLIIGGLAVDIVAVPILGKSLLEGVLSVSASALIAIGVWGELHFEGIARKAGDGIVAEAEARAAEANQKAKEAELALAELEERLAPRKVTQEGQKLIAARISEFSGVTGQIGSSPREIESMRLEMAIEAALAMGGWKFTRGQPTHTPMWPGGIWIQATLDGSSVAAGLRLAESLNEIGVYASVAPVLEDGTPRLFVTVGTKPDANDPEVKRAMEATKAAEKRTQSLL